jgi:DNA repair exonuclease SbcCD ATPase subunit
MSVPAQPGLVYATDTNTNGAQSPAPSPASFTHGASGERTFSEADIANARKQEKDKLYSEITSLKDQWAQAQKSLDAIQEQREQEAAEKSRIQQEKESALQAKKDEEMSAKQLLEAKLRETNDTWEERFSKLQAERDQERALADKERAYNELVDYRNEKLAAAAAAREIAPQFHSFITGDSREQIDAAIEQAKLATASIAAELAESAQARPQQVRGVSPTGYAALGPLDGAMGQKSYTSEDINNMSMKEYAEFRQKTGLASAEARRSQGLFS